MRHVDMPRLGAEGQDANQRALVKRQTSDGHQSRGNVCSCALPSSSSRQSCLLRVPGGDSKRALNCRLALPAAARPHP